MIAAKKPQNEAARLEALYSYDILDSVVEKEFDDLAQLVSDICDTPIALISFVDAERLWCKSSIGLNITEIDRNTSFSAHSLLDEGIFEVEDAFKDERFWDNPLVTGAPYIRFYAGAPLTTSSGYALGALCIISNKPNKLTSWQRNTLKVLSNEVMSRLELRKSKQIEHTAQLSSFLASSVSHETKMPISGVLGLVDLLLKTPLNEKQKHYIKAIKHSGESLLHIADDIMDLSTVAAGKQIIKQKPFDLTVVIQDLIDRYTPLAEKKHIELRNEIAPAKHNYIGDPQRLQQVLANLLSNAIKFTDQGRVVLRMKELSRNNAQAQLRFSVIDTGTGLSEKQQSQIFQRVQQVNNGLPSHFATAGIGLSVCKQLLELMQGDIGIRSEPGKGSNFWFTLPLEVTKKPSAEHEKLATNAISFKGTVLVAENNKVNQIVAKGVLEKLGFTVEIAENGAVALTRLRDQFFDLVFMDCHMPVISGFEAAKTIRSPNTLVQNPTIPIIAMSANAKKEEQKICVDLGINEFIPKPLTQDTLSTVLIKYLQPENSPQGDPQDNKEKEMSSILHSHDVFNRNAVKALRLNQNHLDIMLRTFLETTPQEINLLSQAMIANDVESIRLAAHSIKDSAKRLGGEQIAALAEFIENNADLGHELPVRKLINYLDGCFERLQDTMNISKS